MTNFFEDESAADGGYEDDFDYDEFVRNEFEEPLARTDLRPIWRWVAAILLILFVASFLF